MGLRDCKIWDHDNFGPYNYMSKETLVCFSIVGFKTLGLGDHKYLSNETWDKINVDLDIKVN